MRILLALLIFISSSSAFADSGSLRTYNGPKKRLGRGWAYAWIQVDQSRQPRAIGVTLTKAALTGLPPTHPKMMDLSLPFRLPPYDHVGLDWNPLGHEPEHVYDKPHFDFHFHFLSKHVVHRITCAGADLPRCNEAPDAAYVPRDYLKIPGGVPMMGAHWFDPFSPEFNGGEFTATMINGSYAGRMTFIEPMVTREFLLSRPNFMTMVKPSARVARSGYYPGHYRVAWNSHLQVYSVALVDLAYRAKN